LSFSRAVAAIRQYGGAVLADWVGTGKTFIGLAIAQTLDPGRPIHVLAPAVLRVQWRAAATQTGCQILLHSHELLSRGRLPAAEPGVVLIDESHRFRTPSTNRYETLAPWCVGRSGLLLSATPVVNRLDDLGHQLLLFVRDDALAWAQVPSLRRLGGSAAAGALAQLVITGEDRTSSLPPVTLRDIRPLDSERTHFRTLHAGIRGLELSRDRAIAGMLRSVLLVALASSPLAVADTLGRYRSLLQHALDARAAGHLVSRQEIRRIVGVDGEQLVLWPLVSEGGQSPELALDDLEAAETLERLARVWALLPDAKVRALRALVADGKPSLVFTQAVATVRYLRHQLGRGVAWCTGQAAGLDGLLAARESVLDWFRRPGLPADGPSVRPRLLVSTDVASEGLDLPLVGRVVHYDLPWTAVRLEQRSGRALRLGSRQHSVELIRFLPPRRLESALRREAILASKAALPDWLGLGRDQRAPWRVRARLAARWEHVPPAFGVAVISGDAPAMVGGIRIELADGSVRQVVRARLNGGWSDGDALIARVLDGAWGGTQSRALVQGKLRAGLRGLAVPVRAALRTMYGARLTGLRSEPARRMLRRVHCLAREAARVRNGERLALLERGLRLLRRGHTAGETRLIANWITLPPNDLLQSFARLPVEQPTSEVVRVELVGILLVEASDRGR
jgi:superfamily II DNA or RNA helicase